jgi:hypothetical protein
MNHVEEGTIHAWLDGALDAAQSAEIDAHVKACAECSAKVAEARGLIAASSRILLALDDVPANVIPKKAPVAPVRRWRSAPWVGGLAAAAVLVVLWRAGDVERPTSARDIAIPPIKVVSKVPEPSFQELKQPASPPPPAAAAPVVAERRQSKAANTPQLADGRSAAGAGAAAAASDLASAQAATAPAVSTIPTERIARSEAAKDEAEPVAGCYRIASTPQLRLEEMVVTGAAGGRAPEKAARARGAVASAAPAAVAAQKTVAADAAPSTMVRLDTLGLVRAIGSDSVLGSWAHLRADSVRAIVNARPTIVSSLNKVRCP